MMTKTRRRCWETQNDASQLATRRHPRRRKDPDTGVGSQNVAGPTSALGDPTTVTTSPTRMGTPETTPTNPTRRWETPQQRRPSQRKVGCPRPHEPQGMAASRAPNSSPARWGTTFGAPMYVGPSAPFFNLVRSQSNIQRVLEAILTSI